MGHHYGSSFSVVPPAFHRQRLKLCNFVVLGDGVAEAFLGDYDSEILRTDLTNFEPGHGVALVGIRSRSRSRSVFVVRGNLERGIEKAVCRLWPTVLDAPL
jgi:hypothetical protein